VGDHLGQYLLTKESYVQKSGAPGKVGGSKSTQETCEKSTEVRKAEEGPEAPFMLPRWRSDLLLSSSGETELLYPTLPLQPNLGHVIKVKAACF